ncbi:hypothetical protein DIPPA_31232 [Diplonema papillatum]|nr:hypothetical protein DIPPA_31232 [Diplonema papillatum]
MEGNPLCMQGAATWRLRDLFEQRKAYRRKLKEEIGSLRRDEVDEARARDDNRRREEALAAEVSALSRVAGSKSAELAELQREQNARQLRQTAALRAYHAEAERRQQLLLLEAAPNQSVSPMLPPSSLDGPATGISSHRRGLSPPRPLAPPGTSASYWQDIAELACSMLAKDSQPSPGSQSGESPVGRQRGPSMGSAIRSSTANTVASDMGRAVFREPRPPPAMGRAEPAPAADCCPAAEHGRPLPPKALPADPTRPSGWVEADGDGAAAEPADYFTLPVPGECEDAERRAREECGLHPNAAHANPACGSCTQTASLRNALRANPCASCARKNSLLDAARGNPCGSCGRKASPLEVPANPCGSRAETKCPPNAALGQGPSRPPAAAGVVPSTIATNYTAPPPDEMIRAPENLKRGAQPETPASLPSCPAQCEVPEIFPEIFLAADGRAAGGGGGAGGLAPILASVQDLLAQLTDLLRGQPQATRQHLLSQLAAGSVAQPSSGAASSSAAKSPLTLPRAPSPDRVGTAGVETPIVDRRPSYAGTQPHDLSLAPSRG